MFNLEYTDFQEETYKKIIKKNATTPNDNKENAFKNYNSIIAQIENFKYYTPSLEKIIPLSKIISNYKEDGLHDTMYNFYATNKNLKDKIKKKCKESSFANDGLNCPYCGEERHEMRDLDHFMPRALYPEFSILSNNLIYICSICNQKPQKGDQFLDSNGNRMFLNPYYDRELDSTQILDCDIKVNNTVLTIEFKVNDLLKESDEYLYKVACNHMIGLNLHKRYVRLSYRSLVQSFLNKFRDKTNLSKQRKIQQINKTDAISFINDKIDELGEVSVNNYKLVFWKKLKTCENWFNNISGKDL